MRRVLIALLITIAASFAQAQNAPAPADAPDYSPDRLRQIFSTELGEEPIPQRNVRIGFGVVEFRAFGMQWRVGFLPLLAPLHGSVPGTTGVLPDAFSLNHMTIPGGPPIAERSSDMRRELRRIERLTRVTAKPE
jgi:hypothetical protein